MMLLKIISILACCLFLQLAVFANPYISKQKYAVENPQENVLCLNRIMEARRIDLKIPEIPMASDAVFIRRACLNTAGRIPTPKEVQTFLKDKTPDKRARLIQSLLASPAHADYIAMRFADMLRIKSEFPVNLWPNAVQAFHRKLRDDIFQNRPYSEIVYELLTESGSNFRNPYANYFRTTGDRTPEGLASITALNFLGLRTEKLPQEERNAFAQCFSRIRYKKTMEWKEEIVYTDPAQIKLKVRIPGMGSFTIHSPEEEPRIVLAKAIVSDDNPYFARAFVNRAWSWFFGKGLIDPADDITPEPTKWQKYLLDHGFKTLSDREVQPEALDFLTREFRKSKYDMRKLFSLIMNSQAYQSASVVPEKIRESSNHYFYSYPIRRMEAELISDALGTLTGHYGNYSSVIPEPFTFLPRNTLAIQVADGSISSSTLDLFGRPSRDTGKISERNNNISAAQCLFLLNSGTLYNQLTQKGWTIGKQCRWDLRRRGIENMYLTVLSRRPTKNEIELVMRYLDSLPKKDKGRVWPDLIWVLTNSKEFLYHH